MNWKKVAEYEAFIMFMVGYISGMIFYEKILLHPILYGISLGVVGYLISKFIKYMIKKK